jgi:hypothetical protein
MPSFVWHYSGKVLTGVEELPFEHPISGLSNSYIRHTQRICDFAGSIFDV